MAEAAPQDEKQVSANLHAIRLRITSGSNWRVRDIDIMANGSAFVFYLRSKGEHRFLNVVEEVVRDYYDASIMIPAELVSRSIDRATEHILATIKEDLKRAKSCA